MNQYNEKGERHGLWIKYYYDNKLCYISNYINGEPIGYWDFYNSNNDLIYKKFYL